MEQYLKDFKGGEKKKDGKSENVLAGIVGAFLFSLAGGIVWVLLDKIGFYAGISGLIGVVCAIKGYSIFAGKESKKGIIISVIIAALVMVLAWYACFAWDLHDAYKEWYANGEVDYMPTYFDCFRVGHMFLREPEIAKGYIINLVIGLVLCVIGSAGYISNYSKKLKAKEQEQHSGSNSSELSDIYGEAPVNQAAEPQTTPVNSEPGQGDSVHNDPNYDITANEIGSENKDPYAFYNDNNK